MFAVRLLEELLALIGLVWIVSWVWACRPLHWRRNIEDPTWKPTGVRWDERPYDEQAAVKAYYRSRQQTASGRPYPHAVPPQLDEPPKPIKHGKTIA